MPTTTLLTLTSIAANTYHRSPGEVVTLDSAEATTLVNAGFAVPFIPPSGLRSAISTALNAAGLTVMPSGAASIPAAGGGYYWSARGNLVIAHPSGQRAEVQPLALIPGWSGG
jgi:hypothetical protein